MRPLVSVVIPAYNAGRFLKPALESVFGQTYDNLEVVLVDDGSTDDTPDVAAAYADRIVYRRRPNGGLAAARNTGLELARGELIAWFDADDICMPERIATQAMYMLHNPAVVGVSSDFSAFDERGVFAASYASHYYSEVREHGVGKLFPFSESFDGRGLDWPSAPPLKPCTVYFGDIWKRLMFGNFLHPPTMMMRREARERAGWLGNAFTGATDWEFLIRLAKTGQMAFIDAPLLQYRCHEDQMTSSKNGLSFPLANVRIIEAILAEHGDSIADIRLDLHRVLAGFHNDAAYALADHEPWEAVRHLFKAAKLDRKRARIGFNLLRIAAARGPLQLLRRLRGTSTRGRPHHARGV
jgi:glycosyltransferase involved in cell wall biosynthesis